MGLRLDRRLSHSIPSSQRKRQLQRPTPRVIAWHGHEEWNLFLSGQCSCLISKKKKKLVSVKSKQQRSMGGCKNRMAMVRAFWGKGYLYIGRYNFSSSEKRHYYSRILKFANTILHSSQICHGIRMKTTRVQLQVYTVNTKIW
jgi:hypothetical protein